MNKIILIVVFALFLTACASQPQRPFLQTEHIWYYQHPSYGEVSENSEAYINAELSCESKVYVEGVMVDGVVVEGRENLEKISSDHFKAYTGSRLKGDLRTAISVGRYSRNGSAGNRINPAQYIADYQNIDLPEHIDQIKALKKEHNQCIKNDHYFVASRIDTVEKETGNVVNSVDLNKLSPSDN